MFPNFSIIPYPITKFFHTIPYQCIFLFLCEYRENIKGATEGFTHYETQVNSTTLILLFLINLPLHRIYPPIMGTFIWALQIYSNNSIINYQQNNLPLSPPKKKTKSQKTNQRVTPEDMLSSYSRGQQSSSPQPQKQSIKNKIYKICIRSIKTTQVAISKTEGNASAKSLSQTIIAIHQKQRQTNNQPANNNPSYPDSPPM